MATSTRTLGEANTKAELKQIAYDLDLSIPRGAVKGEIAEMVAERAHRRGKSFDSGRGPGGRADPPQCPCIP